MLKSMSVKEEEKPSGKGPDRVEVLQKQLDDLYSYVYIYILYTYLYIYTYRFTFYTYIYIYIYVGTSNHSNHTSYVLFVVYGI